MFVQKDAGSRHEHAGKVEATNGKNAREKCKEQLVKDKPCYSVWACPLSKLTKVHSDENMIWRETTDQSYRLAKGYSRVVRQNGMHYVQVMLWININLKI